jgi:FHA domain/Transcriptional regulatory protein, C terminal
MRRWPCASALANSSSTARPASYAEVRRFGRSSPRPSSCWTLLISRRPAAVSKQEIRDRLWPDTFVSESTLSSLAARVRRALEDGLEGPDPVRTVHGFGYAFEAEATEEEGAIRPPRIAGRIAWDEGARPVVEGENVIGRGEDVSIRVDIAGISRHHARIVASGGRFTLEDLGSKNGTFLGERRLLEEPVTIQDGDEFRLGRTCFVLRAPRSGTTATES